MQGGFVALLYVTAAVSLGFAALAWAKRDAPGGTPMVVFHVALAVGAVAYAQDIAATALATQMLLIRLWLPAQTVVAVSWLYAALQYAGSERFASRKVAGVLAIEPLLLSVLLAVDRTTVYTFSNDGHQGSLLQAAGTDLTTGFFIHTLFLVVVALAGTTVLVRLYLRSRHLYRIQSAAILVSALAPWAAMIAQSLFLNLAEDASIFAWAVSGMALTVGLYNFKTLDPVPTARKAIVEEMGDGVVVIDSDGYISDVNPAARDILGLRIDAALGSPLDDVVDGLADIATDETVTDGWQEREVTVGDEQRYLEVEVSQFTDRFDRLVGRLVLLRDVTERKQREQQFAQYKTIFDSVNEPVYVLDETGGLVLYNDPFAEFVGATGDELVGEQFGVLLADGELVPTGAGGPATVELTMQTRSGELRPCESDVAPISFDGSDSGAVGVVRDVSKRKEIESELVETSERLETLVEASPLAIVASDLDGVVEVWNPAAEELFGWSAQEVVGQELPIIPEDQYEQITAQHERVLAGERLTGLENALERKDGSRVEVSVSIAPIHDASGDVAGSVSIIADITDRKERERKLKRQNERLDEFADIVSHDLRNPLQVASGNLELLDDAVPPDANDRLDGAMDALERMETLIESTLTLAKEGRDIEEPEPIDFVDVVESAWQAVSTEEGTLSLADPPRSVESDPQRLSTLLENLFRNAVEHGSTSNRMESGDSFEHGRDGDHPVTVTVGGLDGGFFVADDGTGIPESEREAVFVSGYSTDADGTGFGLSIVKRIADAHGWTVSVTESETGGARFEFTSVSVPQRAE